MADTNENGQNWGGNPPGSVVELGSGAWEGSGAWGSDQTPTAVRPLLRPPVPVLTVFDDGSLTDGERIRLRGEVFVLGRATGDLILQNDSTISGCHAELRRIEHRGHFQWNLSNLESVNGTFVRVRQAKIFADTIILLGLRRFRLEQSVADPGNYVQRGSTTRPIDLQPGPEHVWTSLVETSERANPLKFPIRTTEVTVGCIRSGCDIKLDDPYIATQHAKISRDQNGGWRIAAAKTRNGVWVSVQSTRLVSPSFFRCGEQFFGFMQP